MGRLIIWQETATDGHVPKMATVEIDRSDLAKIAVHSTRRDYVPAIWLCPTLLPRAKEA